MYFRTQRDIQISVKNMILGICRKSFFSDPHFPSFLGSFGYFFIIYPNCKITWQNNEKNWVWRINFFPGTQFLLIRKIACSAMRYSASPVPPCDIRKIASARLSFCSYRRFAPYKKVSQCLCKLKVPQKFDFWGTLNLQSLPRLFCMA